MNTPTAEPWKEVTKAEFFRVIGTMDVHPSIQSGKYPYTSIWQTPQRSAIGKSVGSMEGGREQTAWFLRHNDEVQAIRTGAPADRK
jgi:hypothetical protein